MMIHNEFYPGVFRQAEAPMYGVLCRDRCTDVALAVGLPIDFLDDAPLNS